MRLIQTDTGAVHPHHIVSIFTEHIEEGLMAIHTVDGVSHSVTGILAIEACLRLCPSVLEGKRLKWLRGAWMLHNVVGHPMMQLLASAGLLKAAMWMHDVTVPRPTGWK